MDGFGGIVTVFSIFILPFILQGLWALVANEH
jgi:hypothetical protein